MPRQTPEEMRRRAQRVLTGRDDPAESARVITMDDAPADVVDGAPKTRAEDYSTSEEGGRTVGRRAPNQRLEMLLQWQQAHRNGEDGLTDEEAAERAGLLGSCAWKRAGECRAEGWIAWHPDGTVRKGHARVNRKVSVITSEGLAALARRELG